MKNWIWILMALVLTGCSSRPSDQPARPEETDNQKIQATETSTPKQTATSPPAATASLPNFGEAPELHNEVWLNTDTSLRLADLRGQVVLLDMWTFG